MTFQRIVAGVLVLLIAALAGAFYMNWRTLGQLRTAKAFVEGYVFAEAVAACEKAPSTTVQMECRDQDRGGRTELGQARQIHGGCELHARCRRHLLRLRSDQEESRHRFEFPG